MRDNMPFSYKLQTLLAPLPTPLVLVGCLDMTGPIPDAGGQPPTDEPLYEALFEQGMAKYAGTTQVEATHTTRFGLGMNAIEVHHFSGDDRGPICMYGDEFFVESRYGTSDTLMIFLQGGGVCLNEICAATPVPILSLRTFRLASLLGIGGLLNFNDPQNPVRSFDVVNAPYCDGSLFAGDVDRPLSDGNPDNGDMDAAYQRGLQNLTATLEVAAHKFPSPPRIVLVGSSGGAYGIVPAAVLIRYYYPDTPVLAISDSGAPIVSSADVEFVQRALQEFNATPLIPADCQTCLANGHLTGLLSWALDQDPNLSLAYMTHARDHVIGEFFMGMTADQFEEAVVDETNSLLARHPGRVHRFVIPSARHTLTMGIDVIDDELQKAVLGFAAGLGVGFVGDDVTPEALSVWSLGGLMETGLDDNGHAWSGYAWVNQGDFVNATSYQSIS